MGKWKDIYGCYSTSVGENIKGKTENKIIVQVPGGVVGDIYAQVSDVPLFENNEEVLLFLKGNKVVGWNQGKYYN